LASFWSASFPKTLFSRRHFVLWYMRHFQTVPVSAECPSGRRQTEHRVPARVSFNRAGHLIPLHLKIAF
jgi:hypothetical protein